MERGYWLPPRAKHLSAYAGFYIDSETIYLEDMDSGWNRLLDGLCQKLTSYEPSFQKRCAWTNRQTGRNRFIILKNEEVEIIAEDDDEYVAVFVISPEDCRNPEEIKQIFPRYVTLLRTALAELYPGHILKRINSQHIKTVG